MSALADPFEARRAVGATGLLREFNDIGVLSAADVHVAARLGELVGEDDEAVRLAVALAVRGPRLGHVFVDLATIRDTATRRVRRAGRPVGAAVAGVDEWLGALARAASWSRVGEDGAAAVGTAEAAAAARHAGLPRPLLARGARGRRPDARTTLTASAAALRR